MPDFTIVTPVLNQAKYVEKCILSVLEQGCNVQYIIIDGGSTDGTIDIIRKYESKIAFWVSEPDSGQSEAINKGLSLATGTFFNWLNADDKLVPNALKTVLKTASQETQLVAGKCEHVDQTGNQIAIGGARIWDSLEATLGNYSMGQPSVFYRTDVLKQLGGLNENLHLCLDMELWFRFLIQHGQNQITVTDQVLSQFLVHDAAKSSVQAKSMKAEKYGVYKTLFSQFEIPQVFKEFFSFYSISKSVKFKRLAKFNQKELHSHFAWHLMVDAYESHNAEKCLAYYDVVKEGSRLSRADLLVWRARISSAKFLNPC